MPKSLLLADDSITIQRVVGITFANEDYEITTVDNGDDAVSKAKEIKPDIVLADVIMPKKNGYEVCQAIKDDPEFKNTPVLLLAGTFEAFDENRAREVGANGHITKPFESQALIDKVNELVGAAPAAAMPSPLQPVAPQPAPAAAPQMPAAAPTPQPPPPAMPVAEPRPIAPAPIAAPATPPPSAAPKPFEPKPLEPKPIEPAPLEPKPFEPFAPTPTPPAPTPLEPKPMEPKPLGPAPMEPKPLEPKPLGPAPVEPKPFEPKPFEPMPPQPPPPEPEPMAPAPLEPAPLEPEPLEPEPAEAELTPSFDPEPEPLEPAPEDLEEPAVSIETAPEPIDLPEPEPEPPAEFQAKSVTLAELAQDDVDAQEGSVELPSVDIDEEGLVDEAPELAPTHEFIPEPQAVGHKPEPAEPPAAAAVPSLTREEVEELARATIEKIAWEVVPKLAETILREEIDKLVKEKLED